MRCEQEERQVISCAKGVVHNLDKLELDSCRSLTLAKQQYQVQLQLQSPPPAGVLHVHAPCTIDSSQHSMPVRFEALVTCGRCATGRP